MRELRIVFGIAFTVLLSACQERDHDNPFDPENPDTAGQPELIDALAGNQEAELVWDLSGIRDPRQLRIVRSGAGDEDQVVFLQDFAGAGRHLDRAVQNGVTYTYRLEVESPGGTWLPSAPDHATPGAAQPWVGDAVGGGAVRLSPDGRDVLFRVAGGGDVLDLDIESSGSVWMADYGFGTVLHVSAEGAIITDWTLLGANTLAVDRATGQIWVGSFEQQILNLYQRNGSLAHRFLDIGRIEDVEPEITAGGGVWAASRFSGVRRFAGGQELQHWSEFAWPVALSRDENGYVWVIDREMDRVSRIFVSTGVVEPSPAAFVDPRDGSLDDEGGFWIADPGRGGVVHLGSSGAEVDFLGIGPADAVTWDPVGLRLWVVFRSERRISAYDASGNELTRLIVGGTPVKVEGLWR